MLNYANTQIVSPQEFSKSKTKGRFLVNVNTNAMLYKTDMKWLWNANPEAKQA